MSAIAILGREVMLQRGLAGLGLDTLDQSGPEILEVNCPQKVKRDAFLTPGTKGSWLFP